MLNVHQISPEPAAYQASSWSTLVRLFRNKTMMKMTKPTYRAPPGWAAREKDGYEFHGMTSKFSFHDPRVHTCTCSFLVKNHYHLLGFSSRMDSFFQVTVSFMHPFQNKMTY